MLQKELSKKALKVTSIGIVVSVVLAFIKGFGGYFGHSYALIADAIESTTDILTSTLLLLGLKWSAKPADHNHPYGHGKIEALIAFILSIALFGAAGLIVKESIQHIQRPHKIPAHFTLVILVVVIITKELMYRYVLKMGKQLNSQLLKADAIHHRSDAVTSIAAFIGISIAIIGGKGYEVADDWAALFAAGFIIYNAFGIAKSAISELLDEALGQDLHRKIKTFAEENKAVVKVEQCHSRKMGSFYQVDMHLWVDGKLTVEEGHEISHQVKDSILEKIPQILNVHIHIEPSY